MAGGLMLYLLATRFASRPAALISVAVYLFLPFPLVASTSFQPDPLMVMVLVGAMLAAVRHHERPTRRRFIVAFGLAAVALLVKPIVAAFFLFPLFAALTIVRDGLRQALRRPSFYAFPALSFLPVAAFYLYSAVTKQFLSGSVESKVNPRLWSEPYYWRGWLNNIESVLRLPHFGDRLSLAVLAVAALSIPLARARMQRASLLALGLGYVLFGLVYTNHISSHDYYSLPLVPVVALSLGLVADQLGGHVRRRLGRRTLQACAAVLIVLGLAVGVKERARALSLPSLNPGGAAGIDPKDRIKEYAQVGRLVHHSTRALMLDWGLGGLWYYGWVAGRYWPNHWDLVWQRKRLGLRAMNADERFVTTDGRYWPAVGRLHPPPSAFIVLEPIELALEPDLSVLLSGFRVLAESPDYIIFDLTEKVTTPSPNRATAQQPATPAIARGPEGQAFLHHFPPRWGAIKLGMTRTEVAHRLGRPHRLVRRRNLSKPVESWFYGVSDQYAIVFIDGEVFVKAGSY
jgi:hypothetical protein